MGLMEVGDTPKYETLMRLEDPYSYRERFTMPKFMMNSGATSTFCRTRRGSILTI